jgi:putative restriction endonuclease
MLEKYIKLFSGLRTDRGRDRYPAITCHRAPHKPFLLLSMMDLIAEGQITHLWQDPGSRIPGQFINEHPMGG